MSEGGLGKGAVLLYAVTAVITVFLLVPLLFPIALSFSDTPFVVLPAAGLHAAMVLEGPATSRTSPRRSRSQRAARHLLGHRCAAARHADRDGAGALFVSGTRAHPGPRALAAGFPDAGHRHRAAAAVHLDQLAFLADQSRHRPHTASRVPVVIRTVSASLLQIDPSTEDAARIALAASKWQTILAHHAPADRAGLFAGGIFAFVTSFDNYAISMWLADAENFPMPMAMFALISRGCSIPASPPSRR